jgi:Leucine-rich repeat (LRR) protein
MEIFTLKFRKEYNKMLLLITGILLCINTANAQNTVVIPDANFAAWLNANIPAAMSGGYLMDTTHVDVTSRISINISSQYISNIDGIQYFNSLRILDCHNNQITNFPELPDSLTFLDCNYNQLVSLPLLPSSVNHLECANNQLISILSLPDSLFYLNCNNNQLGSLPILPSYLSYIDCNYNLINNLPFLPNSITHLECNANQITNLPSLPSNLKYLTCMYNQLSGLPSLPGSLIFLDCSSNQITSLPILPSSLITLTCFNNPLGNLPSLPSALENLNCATNQLTILPVLPNSLVYLHCGLNQLNTLPALPDSLTILVCSFNQLDSLPSLPSSLYFLECNSNQLSSIPILPAALLSLHCNSNQLNSLPPLPGSLSTLYCQDNNISCFPIFPFSIIDSLSFNIYSNPFGCLPNYIPAMKLDILSYPLCQPGNSNGCGNTGGITGFSYMDLNSNCIKESSDRNLKNISLKYYNNLGNLLQQTFTALNGIYHFPDTTAGIYTIEIDSTNMPFVPQCYSPGIDSSFFLTGLDTINFSLICKPGVDVGVQSVITTGLVFPGQQHHLCVVAGDMTKWYNLNCASGTGGTVQITVNGPVSYMGPGMGALSPTVSGNVYTYTIADFAGINNTTDFNLLFTTDTTAQAGDTICINVAVTSDTLDNNMSNNNYSYCYPVINSYDPNIKEVYPVSVQPGYDGWFTYSIHFQNTGSAPAINIRLADTLDANLDLTTFQLINYSHFNQTTLVGNVLTFRFPGINLPDSLSNPEGSIGFVQYRIKPKPNLLAGSQIHNTAHIYFDYNPAIVTNTAESTFMISTSVFPEASVHSVKVYPNPFIDNATFVIQSEKINELYSFEMMDVLGKKVYKQDGINSKTFQVPRSTLKSGIYFYKIYTSKENIGTGKVVIK